MKVHRQAQRIYYIGFVHLASPSGGAAHFLGLARAMWREGIDLTPVVPKQALPHDFRNRRMIQIPYLRLPLLRAVSFHMGVALWLLVHLPCNKKAMTLYTRGGFPEVGMFGMLFRVPSFVELNAILTHEFAESGVLSACKRRLIWLQDYVACRCAQGVIAVSENVAEIYAKRILRIEPRRICVVHNGADPVQFHPGHARPGHWDLDARRVRIGFVGVLQPWVALDPILKAMTVLRNSSCALPQFLIVGHGVCFEKIRARIRQMGLEKRVRLLGYVHHQKLPELMACLDMGLVTYDTSDTKIGSSPLKAFEYMASGCVLLSYADLQLDWIAEEGCGILVDRDNPARIADAMMSLLADRDRVQKMKHAAREYVLRHATWRHAADKTLRFFGRFPL